MMNLGSGSLKFTAWSGDPAVINTAQTDTDSDSEDVSFGLQVGCLVFSPRIAENSVRKQPSIFQSWVTPTRMVGPSMRFAIVGLGQAFRHIFAKGRSCYIMSYCWMGGSEISFTTCCPTQGTF